MLLEAYIRKMLVNGDQWACWHGYHVPVSDQYTVIWTPAGTEMCWQPGNWIAQKHQLTYLWNDAWYTIHVGYNQEGSFVSGYCDVVLPTSEYSNSVAELRYTDLYIDVVIRDDYSVFTKDQEVFDRAALRYPTVEQARRKSFEVLDWLEEHAKHWTGPFTLIPRQLSRVDLEQLSQEEACAIISSANHPTYRKTG